MSGRGDLNDTWVNATSGTVSRDIFLREEIFHHERERIFNRTWLFLAHESEIEDPGEFVVRSMGGASVVVVRGADAQISVLLNSCRHRGVRLCRADSGSVQRFVCPYHGWTYDRTGALLTTGFDKLLPGGTDLAQWGLVRAPRVRSYKGLIFASWAQDGVSLDDYLGDVRWYLDMFLDRTPLGMRVASPPQRSRVRANWKTAAINFGADNQHVFTTHVGPFAVQPVTVPWPKRMKAMEDGVQVVAEDKHCVSFTLSEFDPPFALYPPELRPLYAQRLEPAQQTILSGLVSGAGTIFPNLSFIERMIPSTEMGAGKTFLLRQWQPISATEMEIWSWCLIEREASDAYLHRSLTDGVRNFGIAGLFEQEDVVLWAAIEQGGAASMAREYPLSFMTALPVLATPVQDFAGPGVAYRPLMSEVTQFKFLQHWNDEMRRE